MASNSLKISYVFVKICCVFVKTLIDVHLRSHPFGLGSFSVQTYMFGTLAKSDSKMTCQVLWCVYVVPATQEAEPRGCLESRHSLL